MDLDYDILKKIGPLLITTKTLGCGSSGEVKLGKNCVNQELYAVKIIKRPEDSSIVLLDDDTLREIKIIRALSHNNIVKIYDVIPSPNNIYMIFEYCNGRSLSEYMCQHGKKLPIEDSLGILWQICNAFEVLSKNNIMHRDIKPANIMFHNGVLKIVDFGYARIIEKAGPSSYTLLGTPEYMSPQILSSQRYSDKCDIWSTGILLFKLLTGIHPFFPQGFQSEMNTFVASKLYEVIRNSKIKWDVLNHVKVPWLKDLVYKMLEVEEKDRLNWKQVIEIKNMIIQNMGKTQVTVNFLKPIEEKNLLVLMNYLGYQKKIAVGLGRTAKLFYSLARNKAIQVDENIGMILFYLLCQTPMLLLKNIIDLMNNNSLLQYNLLEQNIMEKIDLEEYSKHSAFDKFREETLSEMKKLQEVNKDFEIKIIKALKKKNNKIEFIQKFLEDLEKGCYESMDTVRMTLKEVVTHFLEYYKKEMHLVENNDCLITFRLLQITNNFTEIFRWDNLNKKGGLDLEVYLEELKKMGQKDLVELIMKN